MKAILLQACILLVRQLTRLSADDFKQVVNWVKEAEQHPDLSSGEARHNFVRDLILSKAKDIAPFALNFVISLAVGYLNKTGGIAVRLKPASIV